MPNDLENNVKEQDKMIINNIQSVLYSRSSENNIFEFSDEKFIPENYELVDDKLIDSLNLSFMSGVFSSTCSAVSSVLNTVSAEQVNEIFEKGVFALVFKEGVNDKSVADLFKNSEGNYITSYHNGKGIDQAGIKEIQRNSPIGNVANTANIVNGIMSVASFALGCYYMSSINDKMTSINSKLEELRIYFDNEKYAQLDTICRTIETYVNYFQTNALTDELLSRFKNQLGDFCTESSNILGTYERELEGFVNKFENCDEKFCKDEQNYHKLFRCWELYKFSVTVYIETVIIDTIVSNNLKTNYLNGQIKILEDPTKRFNDNCKKWSSIIENRIKEVRLPLTYWAKIIAKYVSIPLFIASPLTAIAYKQFKVDELIQNGADSEEEKKRKRFKKIFGVIRNDTFNIEQNTKPLFDYVNRINSIQNNEFAICYHEGKTSIHKKYLETEVN